MHPGSNRLKPDLSGAQHGSVHKIIPSLLLSLRSLLVGNQRKHREQWRRKPWRRRDWAVAVLLEPLELHLQPPHLVLQRDVLRE